MIKFYICQIQIFNWKRVEFMFKNMTKTNVFTILVGIFCALMIISNILGTKTLEVGFIILPCSILTFPALFIINDILSEIYGFDTTKKVILLGLLLNIAAVGFYSIAIMFPSNSPNAQAFASILGTTPRLFLAGLCSYVAGNILNSKILIKLKEKYYNLLFVRCVFSTAVGETVDSVIFLTIGFMGTFSADVIFTMICCQIFFKVLYEVLIYPVTRHVIKSLRALNE